MKIKFVKIVMAGITQKKLKAIFSLRCLLKNEKGKLQCRSVVKKKKKLQKEDQLTKKWDSLVEIFVK